MPIPEGTPGVSVKIKSDNPEHTLGYIVAREEDFGKVAVGGIPPDKHVLFVEPGEVPPPPPMSSPPDAVTTLLTVLKPGWRHSDPSDLRDLAAKISGRTPENREQAVQIIEAAARARNIKLP